PSRDPSTTPAAPCQRDDHRGIQHLRPGGGDCTGRPVGGASSGPGASGSAPEDAPDRKGRGTRMNGPSETGDERRGREGRRRGVERCGRVGRPRGARCPTVRPPGIARWREAERSGRVEPLPRGSPESRVSEPRVGRGPVAGGSVAGGVGRGRVGAGPGRGPNPSDNPRSRSREGLGPYSGPKPSLTGAGWNAGSLGAE